MRTGNTPLRKNNRHTGRCCDWPCALQSARPKGQGSETRQPPGTRTLMLGLPGLSMVTPQGQTAEKQYKFTSHRQLVDSKESPHPWHMM